MLRIGLCVALEFAIAALATAAEPSSPAGAAPQSIPTGVASGESSAPRGRKHWEAVLQQPAGLDFEKRESVSLRELLDALRERHQFSLRIDFATFRSLAPEDAGSPARISVQSVSGHGWNASALPLALLQVAPPISAEQDPVNVAPKVPPAGGNPSAEVDSESPTQRIEEVLSMKVSVRDIDLKRASVATVLSTALDTVPMPTLGEMLEMPLPIAMCEACKLDYIVENDGYLITTRMAALGKKEIRVYSIKGIKDLTAEEVATVIQQTVRPWSWRSQINEFGNQLRGSVHVGPTVSKSIVQSGIQLAAAQVGATVTVGDPATPAPIPEKPEANSTADYDALGNAVVNMIVSFTHAYLSGMQMFHYAEFPTATIQTIPGKLIVRQSQAAHEEIAELLRQLSEQE